jgi:uracil-DNA glycosylase
MGMGLCYPGRDAHGGDKPPVPRCAPTWHPRIRPLLRKVELTLLIGIYAQRFYLGARRKASVGETVAAWRDYLPEFLAAAASLVAQHGWLKRNPWFEREVVPSCAGGCGA